MRTSGIFMIPCILQRDWAFMNKHVCKVKVLYSHELPMSLRYYSLIPIVLLYVPVYVRTLPLLDRLDSPPNHAVYEQ
jgi:hypothetical protein